MHVRNLGLAEVLACLLLHRLTVHMFIRLLLGLEHVLMLVLRQRLLTWHALDLHGLTLYRLTRKSLTLMHLRGRRTWPFVCFIAHGRCCALQSRGRIYAIDRLGVALCRCLITVGGSCCSSSRCRRHISLARSAPRSTGRWFWFCRGRLPWFWRW